MSWTRLRAIAVLLLVCGVVSISPTCELDALPAADVERYYYSDSTYTVEVGYYFLACNGAIIREGQVTKYYKQWRSPCENTGSTCNTYICTGICGSGENQYPCGCSIYSYGC